MARRSLESSRKTLDYVSDNEKVQKDLRRKSGQIDFADEQSLSNEELELRKLWKDILSQNGYLEYYEDITKLSSEEFENRVNKVMKEMEEKAEAEAKAKAEQEAKAKAEQEAKAKAEQEAKAKAEQEAKAKAEAEAKAKAEQEAKEKAEAEAKAKAEQEAKEKAEAKAKAEQEAKEKAEAEAKAKAEQETKEKVEPENLEQENLKKIWNEIGDFDDTEYNTSDRSSSGTGNEHVEAQAEKYRPKEKSIRDEVGEEFNKEGQNINTQNTQSVDLWMNRYNNYYSVLDKAPETVKNKYLMTRSDIVKALGARVKDRSLNYNDKQQTERG